MKVERKLVISPSYKKNSTALCKKLFSKAFDQYLNDSFRQQINTDEK
jgi:hypothetical protein